MRPTPWVEALADAAVVACPVMITVAMSEQRPSLIAGLLAGILAMVGEWTETTETTVGSSPPRKTVDMTLQRQH